MKIVSYNTQHGFHFIDKKIELNKLAEAIVSFDADVVGLNEMRGEGADPEYTAQTETLAELTGMPYFYFAKAIDTKGGPYGNAILSRVPIEKVEVIPIPDPMPRGHKGYYESRCVLKAALAGGFLTAMSLIPTGALQENVWGDYVWLVQLITGTLGSVGFAAIFRLRHRFLPLAALGGFLNWGCYLVCFHFTGEIFLSCLIASGLSCLYAELLAMRLRAPAPLFLIPAFIPSIPGSNLYYTLEAVVRRDTAAITSNAVTTCLWAFGIAAGISAVWASFAMARNIIRLYRTTHHAKKN